MKNKSRRNFIQKLIVSAMATYGVSGINSFAFAGNSTSKIKAPDNMVILFQGDSITDGNRGRNNDPNHIMGHGYAFSIASRVGADYPEKGFKFYNRGVSGDKVNDLENRWQKDTMDLKPDLLSILVGINDASSVVYKREPIISVEKYEEGYRTLLEQTRTVFPNIIFVICEPFILKAGVVKEHWEAYHSDILQRQAAVRKLAEDFNAVFVAFQQVFDKACEKAPADYWIWDSVHPTVAGHELMAREWMKQVEKRIKF